MCQSDSTSLATWVQQAAASTGATVLPAEPPTNGSRRRRLWELDAHAHCPVVGVCLPLAVLRRLVGKSLGGEAVADDYELHCGVIAECRYRNPLAETVQRELDRRCALALRQTAKAKTPEALAAWWRQAVSGDLASALWATLSHARCTPDLAQTVLGDVHMLQHQVGMAQRVDVQRFEALLEENAVLSRELAAVQQRTTRWLDEHARRSEQHTSQLVQLRAQLIGRDTALAAAQEDLRHLEASVPDLKSRFELKRESTRHVERIHQLERALLQSQQEADRQRRRAEEAERLPRREAPVQALPEAPDATSSGPRLDERAVLCVGGRPASVPVYRHLIERTGGRFLHHDGGDEDNPAQLDATLAAADLVICQTGCISHNAYWRVKDHCKRTGKRCVFVETPSTAGLKRALVSLAPQATTVAPTGAATAPTAHGPATSAAGRTPQSTSKV